MPTMRAKGYSVATSTTRPLPQPTSTKVNPSSGGSAFRPTRATLGCDPA
jgi:hypothetical protein